MCIRDRGAGFSVPKSKPQVDEKWEQLYEGLKDQDDVQGMEDVYKRQVLSILSESLYVYEILLRSNLRLADVEEYRNWSSNILLN